LTRTPATPAFVLRVPGWRFIAEAYRVNGHDVDGWIRDTEEYIAERIG